MNLRSALALSFALLSTPLAAQTFNGDGVPIFGLKKSTGQIGIRVGINVFQPIGTIDPTTKAWSAIGGGGGATNFSGLSGQLLSSQVPAFSGGFTCSGLTCSLSAPTSTVLGGVKAATAPAGQFVTGIATDGTLVTATPSSSGLGYTPLKNTTDTFTGTLTATGNIVTQRLSLAANIGTTSILDLQGDAQALGMTTPPFNMKVTEASNGFNGAVMIFTRNSGATGNLREGLHIAYVGHGGVANENIVGGISIGHIVDGGGTGFGWNPYCWVDNTANGSASCISQETDTDARQSVVAKIGLSAIDVSTSVGGGTLTDAGFLVGEQPGARGYSVGLQFGVNAAQNSGASGDSGFGVMPGGTLIGVTGTSRSIKSGIDFTGMAGGFSQCAVCFPVGSNINFGAGGGGGTIISATASSAPQLLFGSNQIVVKSNGGASVYAAFSNGGAYLNLPTSAGTPSATVCMDSSGNLYRKTTSGSCI